MAESTLVLGNDSRGRTVAEYTGEGVNGAYSFRFYLTPCCGADATGVSWGSGVACRGCYAELPSDYGLLPRDLFRVFGDGVPLAEWREKRQNCECRTDYLLPHGSHPVAVQCSYCKESTK